jgi:hypothetical protein
VTDVQTDLNALSLKILAALTPEEVGGCIPYVKTIKAVSFYEISLARDRLN